MREYAEEKYSQMRIMNRLTMLVGYDKLSRETRSLMTISKCVVRWKKNRDKRMRLKLALQRARYACCIRGCACCNIFPRLVCCECAG
jgi:hypothetical protein